MNSLNGFPQTRRAGLTLCLFSLCSLVAFAADEPLAPSKTDVPYAQNTEFRQTLNVYIPVPKPEKPAPIVFWIHGGGWQTGEKVNVQLKPKLFTEMGLVMVCPNHRYVKNVPMHEILSDIAKALKWTHDHADEIGGDPNRIVIMGHSSGAQLAALTAIDERYLKAEGLSPAMFKGCVPVDADTFDIPLIIETATAKRAAAGKPEPKYTHREIFGGKPELWAEYSCTNHIAANKGIPPFLILHVAATPETTAQAKRLEKVLREAGIAAKSFGAPDTNHIGINENIGQPNDPSTAEIKTFLDKVFAK